MKETQNKKILEYLKTGRGITQGEAYIKFGCFRLASRIAEIKAMGYEVVAEMVPTLNHEGKKVYIARYYLKEARGCSIS